MRRTRTAASTLRASNTSRTRRIRSTTRRRRPPGSGGQLQRLCESPGALENQSSSLGRSALRRNFSSSRCSRRRQRPPERTLSSSHPSSRAFDGVKRAPAASAATLQYARSRGTPPARSSPPLPQCSAARAPEAPQPSNRAPRGVPDAPWRGEGRGGGSPRGPTRAHELGALAPPGERFPAPPARHPGRSPAARARQSWRPTSRLRPPRDTRRASKASGRCVQRPPGSPAGHYAAGFGGLTRFVFSGCLVLHVATRFRGKARRRASGVRALEAQRFCDQRFSALASGIPDSERSRLLESPRPRPRAWLFPSSRRLQLPPQPFRKVPTYSPRGGSV